MSWYEAFMVWLILDELFVFVLVMLRRVT